MFFDRRNVVPSGFKSRHPDMEPARGPDIVITSANTARSANGLTTDEESKWADIAFGAVLEGGSRKLQRPDVLSSFILRPVQSEITTDGRSPDRELLDVQCAISAARSLGRAPCVFHAINIVLLGDTLYIRWFDTQGAIYSSGLNLTSDLPLYLVLLLAFQRFRMEDWGVCPELDPNAVTAHTSTYRNGSGISQYPLQLDIEGISVTVNLADVLTALFKDRNPYGGALKVYSARSESELPSTNRSLQRGWLTMKLYWESNDDNNPVDPPDTLCSKRLTYTTRTIREDLGLHTSGQTGSFTPRIVILESIAPAPALRAGPPNDFLTCWFQAIHGHYTMRKYAQYPINPSPDKFLLRRFQDGRCEGAFADLDRVATKAHSSRFLDQHERPNMQPFMALDLLGAYAERTESAQSGESARAAYERMKRTGQI